MVKVATPLGDIEGVPFAGGVEFRGVPFAAPPSAENRFRAPQPLQPWQGTLRANRYRQAAWQLPNPFMGADQIADDCLYLNIWVPEGDGPFPVMVWIHGGGYLSGTPSQLLYNGRRLAQQQQVIVVNVSYRLGAWGYGWFGDLVADLPCDTNLGVRDQIAALQWVQQHIHCFGGDAGQVTVFGESAGGFSVATLLAIPQATALFQRAIVQSGAADFVVSRDEANRLAALFIEQLPQNVSPQQALLDIAPRDFVRIQSNLLEQRVQRGLRDSTPMRGMIYMPMVDNDLIHELPLEAIRRGSAGQVAVIAGACRDEWNLFQYAQPFNGGKSLEALQKISHAEVEQRINRLLPKASTEDIRSWCEQVKVHPARSALDCVSALETDRIFRVPTARLLDALHEAGNPVWGYLLTQETEIMGLPMGACHVLDVPLVFGLVDLPVGQFFTGGGDVMQQLSADMQHAWGRFAQGENPDWAPWGEGRQAKNWGPGPALVPLLSAWQEDFWRAFIP